MRVVQEEILRIVPELLVCGIRLFHSRGLHLLQMPPVGLSVYLSMASRYHAIYRAIDATNPFPQARLLAALPPEAVAEHLPRAHPEGAP